MGYTESLLATNETILYRTKQHWMAPIFGTIAGVLVLIGGVALFIVQQTIIEFDGALGFLNTLSSGPRSRSSSSASRWSATPTSSGGSRTMPSPTRR